MPAYKLPPEANLMAVAHYLEALSWQRDVVKLHAIFGGKNPHPNFVVGGVPSAISVQTAAGPMNAALRADRRPLRSTWSGLQTGAKRH
jgi:hydrogenase large subunit